MAFPASHRDTAPWGVTKDRTRRIARGRDAARLVPWLLFALALSAPPPASDAAVFSTTLAGSEETPPNASTATGTGSATLNADGTLTYTVTSTGFATAFGAAHVHQGGPGVAGPILFGIDCNAAGTACSGTSPVLSAAQKSALVAGLTYFNLHTDAYPGGEIRGQLVATGLGFVAALAGGDETPPNSSPAMGTGSATLNADGTLTYTITSTGFATAFMAAHVHHAPPGVPGPILFGIDCDAEGTACSGTSPPLGAEQKAALLAGDTYFNLHTDAFPGGEIRGQLEAVALSSRARDARVEKLAGKVKPIGEMTRSGTPRGVELTFAGRFSIDGAPDLSHSTAVLEALLGETGGTGELVRGAAGESALPIALELERYHAKKREATYRVAAGGSSPRCQVKVGPSRDGQAFDFTVMCKRSAGATVPLPPTLCDDSRRPMTMLTTRLVINAGEPIVVSTSRSWQCMQSQRRVRELKSMADRKAPKGPENPNGSNNRAPVANFTADPRRGMAPLTVTFTNRSTDPDGHVARFGWSFGDGSGSTGEHPVHTYTEPGDFVVTLVVTDDRGMASPMRRETIRVDRPTGTTPPGGGEANRPPRSDFRVSQRSGAAPLTVAFTNHSSDPDADVLTFSWDFGDGTGSTEPNPTHTYTGPGKFTVTLMVSDARGGHAERPKQETISVTGSGGSPPPGGANHPPVADFRVSSKTGAAPLSVTFSNRSSDPDGDAMIFSWDFGDGTRTAAESPTHVFMDAGKFVVTLMVTDARGGRAARPKQETITVAANRNPYADFRATPRSGKAPLTVRFENRSSDPDRGAVTSMWDFGDGMTSAEAHPTHTYARAGTYVVTLMVTDAGGAAAARPRQDTIKVEKGDDMPGDMPLCEGEGFGSTFDAIQHVIFDSPAYQCSTASCHGSSSPTGDLRLSMGHAYATLVGMPSEGSLLARVAPGRPEMSFLYLKVAAKTLGEPLMPGEGSMMPRGSRPALTAAHLEALRLWILDGAPMEAVVPGTAELLGVCLDEP
jgi:PKD repeat protein